MTIFTENVDWQKISTYEVLTEDFIRANKDKVHWRFISAFQVLSEKFIIEFQNEVNWANISQYQKLTEDFIVKFKNRLCWYSISRYQNLSQEFILKYYKYLPLYTMVQYNKIDTKTLHEIIPLHINKITNADWDIILSKHTISEELMSKYKNRINWYYVYLYQNLSQEFKIKHIDNLINYIKKQNRSI